MVLMLPLKTTPILIRVLEKYLNLTCITFSDERLMYLDSLEYNPHIILKNNKFEKF